MAVDYPYKSIVCGHSITTGASLHEVNVIRQALGLVSISKTSLSFIGVKEVLANGAPSIEFPDLANEQIVLSPGKIYRDRNVIFMKGITESPTILQYIKDVHDRTTVKLSEMKCSFHPAESYTYSRIFVAIFPTIEEASKRADAFIEKFNALSNRESTPSSASSSS